MAKLSSKKLLRITITSLNYLLGCELYSSLRYPTTHIGLDFSPIFFSKHFLSMVEYINNYEFLSEHEILLAFQWGDEFK